MLSLLNAVSIRLSEYETNEGQYVEELNPVAYGAMAFALLLIGPIVVTRLDLDR